MVEETGIVEASSKQKRVEASLWYATETKFRLDAKTHEFF